MFDASLIQFNLINLQKEKLKLRGTKSRPLSTAHPLEQSTSCMGLEILKTNNKTCLMEPGLRSDNKD